MGQFIPAMFDLLQPVETVSQVGGILQNVLQQTGALRDVLRHLSEHAEEFGLPRNQTEHETRGSSMGLACRLSSRRPGKHVTISCGSYSVKPACRSPATTSSAPRKSARRERNTQRASNTMISRSTATIAAAEYGCRVANQVRKIASPSSPRLKAALENGSGDAVTAVRAAVLPPWAAKAMAPPANVTRSCSQGESVAVARYASNAATGTRMKVCSAFQIRSKAGILSAKNSIANSAPLAPITHHLASTSNAGGSANTPKCASSPSVATVAYKFRPAAKLVATTAATISSAGIFIGPRVLGLADC